MTVQPLKRPNYHANPPFCDVSASCLYGAVLVQQNLCIFPRFSYFILAMERQLSACTVVDVDCSRRFRAEAEKDGASHLQFAYTVMWSHIDGFREGLPDICPVWPPILRKMCHGLQRYVTTMYTPCRGLLNSLNLERS